MLITGGAGFVGSSLAEFYKKNQPNTEVYAFDNLKRRGSETNLSRFKKLGVEFIHGDIRKPSDIEDLPGNFDLLIEASAEPSVHAGTTGSPNYLLDTNLQGSLHCFEFARKRVDRTIFLSTSRVYSIKPLRQLPLVESATRLVVDENALKGLRGFSKEGISEQFPTHLARSLYGATKLASEHFVQEYADTYNMKIITNRCGVIAGPGQFGKVDQGVFTLWLARHYFKQPLKYIGFGGLGKQVRDILHPKDLFEIIQKQVPNIESFQGDVFNVGGGNEVSVSLLELTKVCQELTGNEVTIDRVESTSPVDIPYYISDNQRANSCFNWKPNQSIANIFSDILQWIRANEATSKTIFL